VAALGGENGRQDGPEMRGGALEEGLEHHRAGQAEEAEAAYRRVLEAAPDCADAWNLLGVLCCQTGRGPEGLACLERAAGLGPSNPVYQNNLGLALQAAGRVTEAEARFRRALQLDPNYPEAHNNLGNLLLNRGCWQPAIACYQRALGLRPGYAQARNNLGNALRQAGRWGEAEACYREALRLNPGYAEAYGNLGGLLGAEARLGEALDCFRRGLEVRPEDHHLHSNLLLYLHYDPAQTPEGIFAEHLHWRQRHAAALEARARPPVRPRSPERRLRLGYVSADFREHSVAFFVEPVLAAHDRTQFEVYCYSDVAAPDRVTERLAGLAEQWRSVVGLSDAALAELVREDGIDILVDLGGHTAQNRLLAFARKPAPVEVTWLGYPDTTGLASMDYRITDARADPPGWTESLHSERLARPAGAFLCYRAPQGAPEVETYTEEEICFGCLNQPAKLNPPLLRLWAALLGRLPRSRLLIKARGLADPAVRSRLLDWLESCGLERERVELHPPAAALQDHLAFYRRIALALDTFPYQGTTTTCEALWMGVPVVTLEGRTHASRVGASLLGALGLEELIAHTPQQYVAVAAAWAADRERLARLRRSLRARMQQAPLTDARSFTRGLEEAYRAMWRRWCSEAGSRRGR